MPDGPLSDLKVVELADMVSGPHAGKLLAAMGADVVKVEQPGTGDPARRQPPFPDDVPNPETSGLLFEFAGGYPGWMLSRRCFRGRRCR